MKIIYYAIIILFVPIHICAQNSIPKITIDPKKSSVGELMASELVESIEYVPLETRDECLIGGSVTEFSISENYIAILSSSNSLVFLFDRKGKFISQIGNVGGGPEEYLKHMASIAHVDEKEKLVILKTYYPQRIMYFNFKGKLVKSVNTEIETGTFSRKVNNNWLVTYYNHSEDQPYTYEIRDNSNFSLIAAGVKRPSYSISGGIGRPGSANIFIFPNVDYRYNGNVHVKEAVLNDTIYLIRNDNTFAPKYILNAGSYEITPELRGDFQNFRDRVKNFVQIKTAFESSSYLFINYRYDKKEHYVYYNKKTSQMRRFDSQHGIPNDYDGGISIWPQKQENNMLHYFVQAYAFEERLESQKKLTPKGGRESTQKFNTMYNKLDPEDNPVLVIVKLKEEL